MLKYCRPVLYFCVRNSKNGLRFQRGANVAEQAFCKQKLRGNISEHNCPAGHFKRVMEFIDGQNRIG